MSKIRFNVSGLKKGSDLKKSFFLKIMASFELVLANLINKRLKNLKGQINLFLLDDKEIHKLNLEFRNIDKPTDVLSFPYWEIIPFENSKSMDEKEIFVGEVFISLDKVEKQAAIHGHSFARELEILFVHGLLHLMGFDHNNDEEEAEMEGWAKKIIL